MYKVKEFLRDIRSPVHDNSKSYIYMVFIGLLSGAFAKFLDNTHFENFEFLENLKLGQLFSDIAVWLLIGILISAYSKTPIRACINTVLFFTTMCFAYHIYTIVFNGFNPMSYMMTWYLISLMTPIVSIPCWYAKGKGKIAVSLRILILAVLMKACFAIGDSYFDFIGTIETIIFLLASFIFYDSKKNLILTWFFSLIINIFVINLII